VFTFAGIRNDNRLSALWGWRIVFEFTDGDTYTVDYEDYH